MTLVEFAEKISPQPLTEWQKKFLTFYEHAKREHKPIVLVTPMISGKRMLIQIIEEFEREIEQNGH